MLHEIDSHDSSIFVTLTYADEYLPENASLKKRDLQLFMKRLRKSLGKRKIRYYACGEYGDETQRPHYHLIIFGMSLCDDDKLKIIQSWPYTRWEVNQIRKKAFGIAEKESIQYVAKYIHKQLSGELADEIYIKTGREIPFKILSLGIGKEYADKNKKQMNDLGYITINGVKQSIPRYYINRLQLDVDKFKEKAIEKEQSVVEAHTGLSDMTELEAYKRLTKEEYVKLNDAVMSARSQRDKNKKAKVELYKRKL